MEERLLRPHQRSSAFEHSDTECIQTYAAAETVSSHFTVYSSCLLAAFKAPPEKTEEEINHVIGVPSNGNTKHNPSTLKQPVSCIGTVKDP
ncbi:hypothetical protein AVEN_20313-1 [Araneus ventricosus]|uniref:Uncharacterized protein n=1 Tax=Araneus ventricosus TaxID=182803 RepID=A0A4Y2DNB8_ARAVE|nr:hypothetical protein AVEN_20313-1 [Araneus ventricosus]